MRRSPIVILAGEFWAGATGRGLADGFRELGWAVQEVDQHDFGVRPNGSLPLRVAARLTRRQVAETYRNHLLEECRALKPDLLVTIKGVDLTADLLSQIRQTGARTAMYYPDFTFDHPGVFPDSFREYDLFVTTKTFQVDHLTGLLGADRVAYIPHGYVSAVHRPVFESFDEQMFQADVLHAGNHSAYKQEWLAGAVSALPEATFRVVGHRWREHVSNSPLARCDLPGARTGVAYAEAIQSARVNVAVHFGPSASGWQDLVSTRTFEIPACGGFMLHIDSEEVRGFFEPGTEIDVFSSPAELADKLRFYLARPDLRSRMIERAYERCVPAYSYNSRAAALRALLTERIPNLAERR